MDSEVYSSGLSGAAQGALAGSSFGWIGAGVGAVLGGFNGLISGQHQVNAQNILKNAQEAAQNKINAHNQFIQENTGLQANEKAFDLAKSQTGTMTSQTSQSQAYAAQNAQENAGISKSQAAMAGQNAAANKNAEVYDNLLESNKQTAANAIQSEVDAKTDAVNKEIENDLKTAQTKAEAEASKNALTDAWDAAKNIGSKIGNAVSSAWSSVKSFFSDEDLKRFEEADPEEVYNLLKEVVSDYKPEDDREQAVYKNAVDTIHLLEKVYGYSE